MVDLFSLNSEDSQILKVILQQVLGIVVAEEVDEVTLHYLHQH